MASEWFYNVEGKKHGPLSSGQLQALAKSGKLKPTDKVWKEGMAQWVAASTIKGLFPSSAEAVTAKKPKLAVSTAASTDKGRSKTEKGKKPRASDDEAEPSDQRGGSGKAIAIVAVAAVVCVVCLGGAAGVGALYLTSGAPEQILAENKEKPKEGQAVPEEKKETPKGQSEDKTTEKKEAPKDEGAGKKEPPPEQPKEKLTEKKEGPPERPKDKVTEKKGTPPESKVATYDFSKVDYKHDFSKVDYTKGPEGQKLTERSGDKEQKQSKWFKGPPGKSSVEKVISSDLVRFVEQGYYVEKKLTPEDITDSARRLLKTWAERYPKANQIYLKRVKALTAKKELSKLPPLSPVRLRPDISDFRHVDKTAVNVDGVVINKQQKAILLSLEGQQSAGDLFSLDSEEVQFKPAQAGAKLTKLEASKVKAVQTDSDTYFYSTGKKVFISLNATLLTTAAEAVVLKQKQNAMLVVVPGQQVVGELLSLNSKEVQFKPIGLKTKTVTMGASSVKIVKTDNDTYFFNPNKSRFVSLKSLLEGVNRKEAVISDEEKAEAWLQLMDGKVPPNFEFMTGGKPLDLNKMFVVHGRSKAEYVLEGGNRVAYEALSYSGKAHGRHLSYYPNGQPKSDKVFVNSNLHGIQREYFDNGQLSFEVHWIQGTKHGPEKSFFVNGQKASQATYVDGKKEGSSTSWYDNGKTKSAGVWLNGVAHGDFVDYFDNGQVRTDYHYVQGKQHGIQENFYASGQRYEKGVYEHGKLVGFFTRWRADGSKLRDSFVKGVHDVELWYRPDGSKEKLLTFLANLNVQDGMEIWYFPPSLGGGIDFTKEWSNGRVRVITQFNPNGTIADVSRYP